MATIDVVTSRIGFPLAEFLKVWEAGPPYAVPTLDLSAVSYRPLRVGDEGRIEVRVRPIALGAPLPTILLGLDRAQVVPLELEATYDETRRNPPL